MPHSEKFPSDFPIGGPLLSPDDLARDLGCTRRHIDKLFELQEIPSFKMGTLRKTTAAARDEYIKRLIAEEAERQNALVNGG